MKVELWSLGTAATQSAVKVEVEPGKGRTVRGRETVARRFR